MDVLYYIGNGSSHNNDELRLSLRSLEKHCKDVGKVWIVGNKPAFLRNVEYIWVADERGKWWWNAFNKTKTAILAGISDDFLLMNDDFFMIDDFEAESYPYFHKGDIKKNDTDYQQVVYNTGEYLKSIGAATKHFGIHCPIRINGKKYLELEKHLTQPMSVRCLYGNLYCKGRLAKDVKNKEIHKNQTKCYSALSYMSEDIYQQLLTMFPNPSRWEEENV